MNKSPAQAGSGARKSRFVSQHFMETGVINYTDIDARVEFYKRGI